MSEASGLLGYLVLFLIIIIGLFLLLREVNCWYWKINKSIELMEENNRLLTIIADYHINTKVVESSPAPNIPATPQNNTPPPIPANYSTPTDTYSSSVNNVGTKPTLDNKIPPVRTFVNGKIIFADGVQGEIMTDINNRLYISIGGSKRYYYDSEENAINAIYILKTQGEISRKGLTL